MTDIKAENQKIQDDLQEISRNLLEGDEVDVIIGYKEGTTPLTSAPIFITEVEDVDKLIWDNLCYVNLAKYLVPSLSEFVNGEKKDLRVGIISKGCVARAIIHLAKEKQINLDNVKIIGIPCNGILNRRKIEREVGNQEITEIEFRDENLIVRGKEFEKSFPIGDYLNELCKTCIITAPPISSDLEEFILGESQPIANLQQDFEDLAEFEAKSPDEKWSHLKNLIQDCTRCYACREACPLCYCNLCFVDQNMPTWFGKTTEFSDTVIFHMVRALHVAGRCVSCGACSSVCPMGIDLSIINRKLEKIVKERFDFTAGLNLETMPPMMTQKMDDPQEFMLEEET